MRFRWLLLLSTVVPLATWADISTQRQTELLYLLKQDCGSCHGMTLKGGLGPALTPAALALRPNELLVTTILDGRSGTPMAPWRFALTPQEATWLVDILRAGVPHD